MIGFIFTATAISLSGVMAPGPITAATLAAGAKSRHAGAFIGVGHIVVELPLILLLATGVGAFLQSATVGAWIGLAGGLCLLLMGVQLLISLRHQSAGSSVQLQQHPFLTGIVLTGANPYFLLWWATVGLALTSAALELGVMALGLFALIHWLCDVGWLEVLSLAGFKGSETFGQRSEKLVAAVCAVVLIVFAGKFLYDAGSVLVG